MATTAENFDAIKTGVASDDYRRNHVATFGVKLDRYCPDCGLLPGWCECADVAVSCESRHGFFDREGKYHPAPGCDAVVKGP